jgi:hypothetical protein
MSHAKGGARLRRVWQTTLRRREGDRRGRSQANSKPCPFCKPLSRTGAECQDGVSL